MSESPFRAALKGRCPRCGSGKLYQSFLTIAPECSECHLVLGQHEQGDGPAFFAILIMGTLAGIFSAIVEVKYTPPFWLHAVLWIPFVLIGSVLSLRILKGMLVAAQYRLRKEDFK